MAKGNWSKYQPKSRCFKCGKALGKKEVLRNPQNKIACKLHAAEHSVQPTLLESEPTLDADGELIGTRSVGIKNTQSG